MTGRIAFAVVIPEATKAHGRSQLQRLRFLAPGYLKRLEKGSLGPLPPRARSIKAIETEIGRIARPKNVWIVPDMPKTRSGKIMRRVIAAVSNFTDVGDTTTLANPEIVEGIRRQVQTEKVTRGEVPRQLSAQELEEIKAFGRAE